MEILKTLIPEEIKRRIYDSTTEDLPSTCTSLIDFFRSLPRFHQVVRELSDPEFSVCGKDQKSALSMKEKGNECFRSGNYPEALRYYTKALCLAPVDTKDINKNLVALLFVNRASAMHKMGLSEESVRDSSRALVVFPCYGKAWYRRGKANESLGNHDHAIKDLNLALKMESSSARKKEIESELQVMVHQMKGGTCNLHGENKDIGSECVGIFESSHQKLHMVTSLTKGKGMASKEDIFPSSLIHSEEPYAAVVFKHCRETHCQFCFKELPADTVPCSGCTISLYCCQSCQELAGGRKFCGLGMVDSTEMKNLSTDLEQYIMDINLSLVSGEASKNANLEHFPEHRHECHGVNWPAVLPSEIVLAGRIMAKTIEKGLLFTHTIDFENELGLCHHYAQVPPVVKLEWHIYSAVLMYCLRVTYNLDFLFTGLSASQLIILISQIMVNSMAIVHIIASPKSGLCYQGKNLSAGTLACVEQVRVGQAVYLKGSLFNHSCRPNVHAYFVSRILYMRTTEHVPAGSALEISYGPELGKHTLMERRQLLECRYSFMCQCNCCTELNFSDLVFHAFRCINTDCSGVVLDSPVARHLRLDYSSAEVLRVADSELVLSNSEQQRASICKVACRLLDRSHDESQIDLGYCLVCGSYRNLESSNVMINKIKLDFERLREMTTSNEVTLEIIDEVLCSLRLLRSIMHAYSKDVAQAEDNLAEAFYSLAMPQAALPHCKGSIEVLEKLYGTDHIAVANELVKLAGLYMSLDDKGTAANITNRAIQIFKLFYGSHCKKVLPYLESLMRETEKIA